MRGARELAPAAGLAVIATLLATAAAHVHAAGLVMAAPAGVALAAIAILAVGVTGAIGWACSRGWRSAAALDAIVLVAMPFLYQAGVCPASRATRRRLFVLRWPSTRLPRSTPSTDASTCASTT